MAEAGAELGAETGMGAEIPRGLWGSLEHWPGWLGGSSIQRPQEARGIKMAEGDVRRLPILREKVRKTDAKEKQVQGLWLDGEEHHVHARVKQAAKCGSGTRVRNRKTV